MISTIIIILFLQCYGKVANIRKQGIVAEYTSIEQPEDVEQMSITEYDQRGTLGEGYLR